MKEAVLTGNRCLVCQSFLLQAVGCDCGCKGKEFCPKCIRKGSHE